VWCDPLPDRVFSAAALQLQLHQCQRTSDSAFALNMPVAAKDFHILPSEPKGWRHKSPTGADVTSWFCGDCGGRIYEFFPQK